jgi:hypothetical protein
VLDLVAPLAVVAAEPMDEHQRALRLLGRDVDDAQPEEGLGGEANLAAVELDINVHAKLSEANRKERKGRKEWQQTGQAACTTSHTRPA